LTQTEKVVLLGTGVSKPFALQVKRVLSERFGIESKLAAETENIRVEDKKVELGLLRSYVDHEGGSKTTKASAEALYRDSLTYILQQPRVYDATLPLAIRELERKLADSHPEILEQISGIRRLVESTDTSGWTALHSVPDFNLRAIEVMADRAKRYGAKAIRLASAKSSYEWAHMAVKKYAAKGIDEADTLMLTIQRLRRTGVDGWIVMHPHAPNEVLEHAQAEMPGLEKLMDVIDVNPQSGTKINGITISLDEVFSGLDCGYGFFHPFDRQIKFELAGKRDTYGLPEKVARKLVVIDCPDLGALDSTGSIAQHYNLTRVTANKNRFDEGETERGKVVPLTEYLHDLTRSLTDKGFTPTSHEYEITLMIMDDKLNSGGTANREAKARKEEISKYNTRHGTRFKLNTQIYCSHIRTPDLTKLHHDNLDRIVVLDSVIYNPPIPEQLSIMDRTDKNHRGISNKVKVLNFSAARMVAAGIALDLYNKDVAYKENIDSLKAA
jgi:hypothetical protein